MKTLPKLALIAVLAAAGCTVIDPSSSSRSSSSSGDSSSSSLMTPEQRVARFSEDNLDHLKQDISAGHGEYLAALATLLKVDTAQQRAFFAFAQSRFAELFPTATTGAGAMLTALSREMRADPRFAPRVALN